MYNKKLLEHFMNPRNVGIIENPDGVGQAGNIMCGDVMFMFIKVNDKGIIEDIKFKTFGCAAAIATSSIATELAKGKSIEDALKIESKDIIEELGGLPAPKIHCSLLAVDALREAIYDYLKKSGKEIPEWLEKEHERIQKQYNIVEDRYKEFIEKQKKMLFEEKEK